MSSGKLLNDFTGHNHTSYRCRACFGHEEAMVVFGDEDGRVWAWDLVDVNIHVHEYHQHIDVHFRLQSCNPTLRQKFMIR